MPWSTPTLREVRSLVRDAVNASLPGADANVPNSVLRVLSDNQGALCHLTLQYVDWLSLQLLPDTAETEWLDRHGEIWLVNADGSPGRKMATLATGTAQFPGHHRRHRDPGRHAAAERGRHAGRLGLAESGGDLRDAGGHHHLGVAPVSGTIRALDPGALRQPAGRIRAVDQSTPIPGVRLHRDRGRR